MAAPQTAKPAADLISKPASDFEQPGGRLVNTDTSLQPELQIRCDLVGSDTARCGDLIAQGHAPVFKLCRLLVAAGADPKSALECYRGTTLALTVKSIGVGAGLTIKENDSDGLRVARWQPWPSDRRVERHVCSNDDPASIPHPRHHAHTGV